MKTLALARNRSSAVSASAALRGLIDRIVLSPGLRRGEVQAQLFGDLEAILAFANDNGRQRRETAAAFPGQPISLMVNSWAGSLCQASSTSPLGSALRRDCGSPWP